MCLLLRGRLGFKQLAMSNIDLFVLSLDDLGCLWCVRDHVVDKFASLGVSHKMILKILFDCRIVWQETYVQLLQMYPKTQIAPPFHIALTSANVAKTLVYHYASIRASTNSPSICIAFSTRAVPLASPALSQALTSYFRLNISSTSVR